MQDTPVSTEKVDTFEAWRCWWMLLLGAVIMVVGFGIIFVTKKKNEDEKK